MPERYDINGNPIGFFSVEDEGMRYVDPTVIQPAVVSANRNYWEAQKWARENVSDPRERTAPYVAAGLGATMAAPFVIDGAVAGGLAAANSPTMPLWKAAARRMAIDLPAFEAIDRLPQAWGDERFTTQGTNLIKQTTPIGRFAPWAVDAAGPFIAGMVSGMAGDMMVRGTAAGVNGILNGIGRRAATNRAGYFEPIAEMMQERAINDPTSPATKDNGIDVFNNQALELFAKQRNKEAEDALATHLIEKELPEKLATVVNEDGSINANELAKAYRQVLRSIDDMGYGVKLGLNKKYHSSNGDTTLKEHISDVVRTAQGIPVPAGSSRAELVRSALAHDIGKIATGQEGGEVLYHPGISESLLTEINYPEFNTPTIRSAVHRHMDDHILPIYKNHGIRNNSDILELSDETLNYDLLHALQAADVARGASYDEAAMRYPQLFTYNKATPFDVQLYSGTEEEQLANVINPILQRQGYPRVHNIEELTNALRRHRSLFRGVRDPAKDVSGFDPRTMAPKTDAERNYSNASKLAEQIYGTDTPETRMLVSLGNAPLSPTGYGRQDLFNLKRPSSTSFSQFTQHRPDILSKRLKISPYEQDALYASVSPEILQTYSTASTARGEMPAKVTFPLKSKGDSESLVDFMERGEWQLYNGSAIMGSERPMSSWQLFEEPYRLQTGRSLQADMAKELPESIKKFEKAGREVADLNNRYSSTTRMAERTSYLLSIFGKEYGVDVSKVLRHVGGNEVLIRDKKALLGMNKALNYFYSKNAKALAELGIVNEKMAKAYEAAVRKTWQVDSNGVFAAAEEKDRIGKYIFNKSTFKKIINQYFENVPRGKSKVTSEYKRYLTDPKSQLNFMRSKGLHPLWEMPSFGKTEFFSTNGAGHQWGTSPATRNQAPSTGPAQGIVVGSKGEKLFDVTPIPETEFKEWIKDYGGRRKVGSGNRDAGQRYLGENPTFAVTRKTFTFGGILDRLNKHYNGDRSKIIQAMQYARGGFKRDAATDAGDQYYDIVRQRRNSAFNALLRAGMTPDDAARLAPMIVTQQTMEGGWVLNRKDNNYGGMKSAGKTIVFDSEDDFQDAYIKMLDSKWHNGRAVENSWRSARDLDDWARILNREDLGLATKEAWEKYNRGKQGNDFVYLYAPQWENNNKPYREHLKKTEDRTAAYLKMVEADEPLMSLSPRQEERVVRQMPIVPEQPAMPLGMFRTMIPTSVQQKMPAAQNAPAQQQAPTQAPLLRSLIPTSVQKLLNSKSAGGVLLKDYRSGGKIHIKPENRGKFTALKKRTGHSASWFKAHGTPAQKKMAVFALNSKKWKHGDGGLIERYGIDKVRAAMQKVKR